MVRKRNAGYSLVELMVSLAILSVIMIFLTYVFMRQSRTYAVVDQVAEAQQSLRAIAALIERDVRTTAFMVPESAAVCGLDATGSSDVLFVTDASAIDPTGHVQPELGVRINSGYSGSGTENLSIASDNVDGSDRYDLDGDGTADSDFLYDTGSGRTAGVIVVDRNDPTRGASCGFLDGYTPGSGTITVDFTLDGAVTGRPLDTATGTPDLVAVPAHYYRVDSNDRLIRDGMVLAHDVEDLQLSLFYDADGDGSVGTAANELPGSDPSAPQYDPQDWDNRTLREIRLAFVVRTQSEDRDVLSMPGAAQNTFQTTFNRSDPGGSDGFRRRVHRARVRPRNVGLR